MIRKVYVHDLSIFRIIFFLLITVILMTCTHFNTSYQRSRDGLWDLYYNEIKGRRFVDLTHSFFPGIPHWKGFPDEKREIIYGYESGSGSLGSGFLAEYFCHVGQWGTHVDPPAHFHRGMRTLDLIPPEEMILPLVVLDAHHEAALDPDYTIAMEKVREWEGRYGLIPPKAFIAMRTDWSKRWPSQKAMQNIDENNIAHYPGWSLEVLSYLIEQRDAVAIGHETTDTDPGVSTSRDDYSLESYVLGKNRYQIELLTNLDQVPEAGAVVFVSFPKPKGGSGFPARVIAMLP